MRVSEFDFDLPQDRVALQPVEPRDAARLLLVDPAARLRDLHVHDLTAILTSKDVLVVNDTRVIPARLRGLRRREASAIKVEAMLHKRQDAETWLAFARPAKKLATGDVIIFGKWQDDVFPSSENVLEAIVQDKLQGGEIVLRFSSGGTTLDGMIAKIGEMPLPPYIASKRKTGARDERDYQTIYAAHSDCWVALYRHLARQVEEARGADCTYNASCRCGNFLAGDCRRHVGPPDAFGIWRDIREDCGYFELCA